MKTVQLYNNSITLNFSDDNRHRYTIEETDHSPLGVTTVLDKVLAKPALLTWPMNEALKYLKDFADKDVILTSSMLAESSKKYREKSNKGKDSGTLIHRAVQVFLEGHKQAVLPMVAPSLLAFQQWFKSQNFKVIGVEQLVYSKKFDYAGTFDSLLEINHQPILCDLKTTNPSHTSPLGIYPEMFAQLGAYSLAYTEAHPESPKIKDLMIIRLPKPIESTDPEGKLIYSTDDIIVNTLKASEVGLSVEECEQAWLRILFTYRFITPLAKKLKEA